MKSDPPEISLRTRWLLYAGAWGAAFFSFFVPALLERTIPERNQVLLIVMLSWLFPTGLSALLNRPRPLDELGLLAVLWLAYLGHGVLTLRSRTRIRFYGLLLILAIILALNVVGCHRIGGNARAFG